MPQQTIRRESHTSQQPQFVEKKIKGRGEGGEGGSLFCEYAIFFTDFLSQIKRGGKRGGKKR